MRIRAKSVVVMLAASVLLVGALVLIPRIIEAKRFQWLSAEKVGSSTDALATKDTKTGVIVGASAHNGTSQPLRNTKQLPLEPKIAHEATEISSVGHIHNETADPV